MISRMFVHVNKDPLFLSHASLETSLSHLGGEGLWIPQPIMTPEFWPLSIHELKEKREREREKLRVSWNYGFLGCLFLFLVGYDYKEIKVLYLITVIIVTLSREFDIG